MTNPLVSICCITYNHKEYIRDAIEGFLIQKTNFPIEIIIHDDASMDGTAQIVKEYANKHPDLFVTILQKENQWSKGIRPSPTYVWPRSRGKYIAICEGDDYWTDPSKLQKQVDFLEEHDSFSFCVHRYRRHYINDKIYAEDLHPELFIGRAGIIIDHEIFKRYWLTQPLTAIIRQSALAIATAKSNEFNYFRDINLFYFLLKEGKGYCMNFVGGVYNIHDGGIQAGLNDIGKINANYRVIRELYVYEQNRITEFKFLTSILAEIKLRKSLLPILKLFSIDISFSSKVRLLKSFASRVVHKIAKVTG